VFSVGRNTVWSDWDGLDEVKHPMMKAWIAEAERPWEEELKTEEDDEAVECRGQRGVGGDQ